MAGFSRHTTEAETAQAADQSLNELILLSLEGGMRDIFCWENAGKEAITAKLAGKRNL